MIVIYTKPDCPYCSRLLRLLERTDLSYENRDVIAQRGFYDQMVTRSRDSGVPQAQIHNVIIFDYDTETSLINDIKKILEHGDVDKSWMEANTTKTQFTFLKESDIER